MLKAFKIECPQIDTVVENCYEYFRLVFLNESVLQKADVRLHECVLKVSICVSLTVGTLRTKWKRLDLRGRRGKSAK